jgi:hypothetical protein
MVEANDVLIVSIGLILGLVQKSMMAIVQRVSNRYSQAMNEV